MSGKYGPCLITMSCTRGGLISHQAHKSKACNVLPAVLVVMVDGHLAVICCLDCIRLDTTLHLHLGRNGNPGVAEELAGGCIVHSNLRIPVLL